MTIERVEALTWQLRTWARLRAHPDRPTTDATGLPWRSVGVA